MSGAIYIASYKCQRCGKSYMINVAHTFGPCTPDFCHECTDYLAKQHALIPVDKDGKETKQ